MTADGVALWIINSPALAAVLGVVSLTFRELSKNNIANTILYHYLYLHYHFNGLVQGRRNSSALAMDLRFSYSNPSIFSQTK